MKPHLSFEPGLFQNNDRFGDPFFKRFKLRHPPQPIKLSDQISKNYLFPTFYADVACSIGIFHCDYDRAASLMPHSAMRPVRMTLGRSLVLFSCYHYRNVLGVPPYCEIAMTIPVMVGDGANPPVLPMIASSHFSRFGYYVFSMPVTSKENEIRGRTIWGLPKVTQEIEMHEEGGYCVTTAYESEGSPYFELKVPLSGKTQSFDVTGNLYSKHEGLLLKSQTCFAGEFQVNKYMKLLWQRDAMPEKPFLKIGTGASARVLHFLKIEQHPFQLRYTPSMNSCFDLGSPYEG